LSQIVPRSYTLREKWRLLWGKVRRFGLWHFRRGYVQRQEAARSGDCARCGTCCKLLFQCPFLSQDAVGMYLCTIHNSRPGNCRMFPVDPRDFADRDIVSPDTKCGYRF
jgi:hypothetical protein